MPTAGTAKPDRLSYTIEDARSVIGIGRSSIYKLIDEGKLTRIRVAGRSLIKADSVRRLIDEATA